MEEAVASEPVQETDATPISEEVALSRKSMQVDMTCPVHAFQTIVSRTTPDYIVTLHKLLTTIAECASILKK